MKSNLKDIEKKLSLLQTEFTMQMNAIEDDVNAFHKQLLNLGVKNPESQELIEFIVFINDRIETKQSVLEDVLKDTVKSLIDYKKELINVNYKILNKINEIDERKPQNFWQMALGKIKNIADLKIVLGFSLIIGGVVMKIFWPEASDEFLKYLLNLVF